MAKRRRLKKSIRKALKISGYTTAITIAIGIPNITNVLAQNMEEAAPVVKDGVLPVYTIKSGSETAKNTLLENVIVADKNVNSATVDRTNSTLDVSNLNLNEKGIQVVNLNASITTTDSNDKQNVTQEAIVVVSNNEYPSLRLKTDTITIDNDGTTKYFLPESYISFIHDTATNSLPSLTYEGLDNVDLTKDGYYSVTYKATNSLGYSTEKVLTIHVQTPQWLIEQRAAEEAAAKAKAEEEARLQAEKEEAERLQQEAQKRLAEQEATTSNLQYSGGSNPYSGGWSNCTYGAWQALYNARGIALPGFGDASSWYSNAASAGYAVSDTPTVGGIAVYRGHVAYVDAVNGDSVHIVEGGYSGHYNERWVSIYGTGTKSIIGYINV